MVTILPPDLSLTFIGALLLPLILGFIVGVIIKKAIMLGVAVAVLILVLIFIGVLTPAQVIQPLVSLFKSGPAMVTKATEIAGFLPYSSVTFLIGAAIGFLR